jgi:hypothetical protein
MKKLGLLMLLLAGVQTLSAQTAQLGFVQVCKVAGAGVGVGTNFTFNIPSAIPPQSTQVTVAAGAAPGGTCSAPVQVTAGAVAITETLPAGTVLTGVSTLPSAALLVSSNLAAGAATVTVNAGGQTIVTFTDAVPLALTAGFYFTTYYSNAQGTLRITNHGGAQTADPGDLCAMIYVFDAQQELTACCGCRVTPNGLQTINVKTQLLVDTLTRVTPNTGVIQIVSGAPTGTNPIKNHNNDAACDPTTVTLNDELEAWVTHIQNKVGTAFPITETQSDEEELSLDEFTNLEGDCAGAIKLGSGVGRCDCGVFENVGDGVTAAPVAP